MRTETPSPTSTRSAWGRSRFGGGQTALITASLLGGLVLAALFSLVLGALIAAEHLGLFLIIGTAVMAPVACAGVWATLVDRSTVRGAVSRPERTIENDWFDKAAVRCFYTVGIILGPAIPLFLIAEARQWWPAPPTSLVLTAVLLLIWGAWAVHYQLIKRAQS